MNTTDCVGETECIGMRSGFGKNLVWSKEFVGEFVGGSSGTEELCFDKGLLSDDEVRCGHTFGVCGTLISALCFGNCGLEFLVEFV